MLQLTGESLRLQLRIDLKVSDKVAVCVENIFQSGEGFVFLAQLDVRNRQCIGIRLLLLGY